MGGIVAHAGIKSRETCAPQMLLGDPPPLPWQIRPCIGISRNARNHARVIKMSSDGHRIVTFNM